MTSFEYLSENARFAIGMAISIALIVAGVALLLDAFGVLFP